MAKGKNNTRLRHLHNIAIWLFYTILAYLMSNYERHCIYVTLKWKEPQGLSHTYETSQGLLSEERPPCFLL
jgi:hypothetical protein